MILIGNRVEFSLSQQRVQQGVRHSVPLGEPQLDRSSV